MNMRVMVNGQHRGQKVTTSLSGRTRPNLTCT